MTGGCKSEKTQMMMPVMHMGKMFKDLLFLGLQILLGHKTKPEVRPFMFIM